MIVYISLDSFEIPSFDAVSTIYDYIYCLESNLMASINVFIYSGSKSLSSGRVSKHFLMAFLILLDSAIRFRSCNSIYI